MTESVPIVFLAVLLLSWDPLNAMSACPANSLLGTVQVHVRSVLWVPSSSCSGNLRVQVVQVVDSKLQQALTYVSSVTRASSEAQMGEGPY